MSVWLPASSIAGLYFKKRNLVSASAYMYILDKLKRDNKLRLKFSLNLFTHTDSKEPESAGILGGIVGSFLTITICILCTLPIGVLSALFLEEYMKKSLLKSILEININNLAAVPSIVYGLLGLAIFINILGVPRSSSLVGGMTLALMTLPTIIVTTRQSIKAIPSFIKYGVLAIGASPMQTTMDYTLPLAMPGIITGTLLSIARAIGETAPLIMLGMIAFIVDIPEKFTDPTTVVPVLIYTWSDSAEYGFLEKTSAAILVLIILIIILNYLALTLRKKHELR
jgi:phosphate transport system permease protein